MKFFNNKLADWLPLIIVCIGGLIAAGRISSTQSALVEQINFKLDREIYDREQTFFRRDMDRIQDQLNRMEQKIDDLNTYVKANP